MRRILMGAVALLVTTAVVSAQARAQDAPPAVADSAQTMMQQMMQRMESMHQMMQDMQSHQQMMHDMMQQMHGGQGMQGMNRTATQRCIMSGPEGALSALLMGPVSDLTLTEAQRAELSDVLERAQDDAMEVLTEEQRARLEASPAMPAAGCEQQGAQAHGAHAGH